MPHWISLAVTYLAIAGAYILIIRLGKKCTTTHREDSPVKTEPSPTGQTLTTSQRAHLHMGMTHGKLARMLQDDTAFRSRLSLYSDVKFAPHRPVSDFYSERSTDGGHSDEH